MTVVLTQEELDTAIRANADAEIDVDAAGCLRVETRGRPVLRLRGFTTLMVEARGSSQPRVEARDSSQPRVVAWDSSQPRVVAWDSSQPRVEARGSSQPHVEAWDSSQPRVAAWHSSQPRVEARGSSQPHVEAWASSQPRVEAWDSSQPHVVAWHSSQPRVEARGSSQPHVVARDSSQPHVAAWGSSQPHVEARDSSQPHVAAWGYAQLSLSGDGIKAEASTNVAILLDRGATADGGCQITVRRHTPIEWCEYYGVEVTGGVAVLYKAVNDGYRSPRGGDYTPGTAPIAPDWDGGKAECGGGLHFSPTPMAARSFYERAARFVACPVALADFVVHPEGDYPEKVKAARCAAPVWECDAAGEAIAR